MFYTLFHGTSKKNSEIILSQGWDSQFPLFLTDDKALAHYYGESSMEDMEDDDYAILKVIVEEEDLEADQHSFDEPISFILKKHVNDEDEWHEGINNGSIPYPEKFDFETSLEYANAVKISNKNALDNTVIFVGTL